VAALQNELILFALPVSHAAQVGGRIRAGKVFFAIQMNSIQPCTRVRRRRAKFDSLRTATSGIAQKNKVIYKDAFFFVNTFIW
jgi:hypothetical protein